MKFKFVEPTEKYKEDSINYVKETIESGSEINGVGSLDKYLDNYEKWLEYRDEVRKCSVTEDRVPGEQYFMVNEQDEIIGMCNLRTATTDLIRFKVGHIGYSIRPSKRGNGYNKINLYLGLLKCKEYGIKEAVLTAAEQNTASWKTMEALGGKLEETFEGHDELVRRYVIDVDKSIEEYKDKYERYLI